MLPPDELTAAQEQELLIQLQELHAQIKRSIEAASADAKPVVLDQSAVGRLSRMEAIQAQQLAKSTKRGYELRLQQVEQALSRAGRGEYGFCRSCEEPIGFRRLRARPETPLCALCQSAREASG